jgi:LysR family transcriptional regulator, benzoate and cis,cis-muconate-responsive activator of ben and cat genes
MEDTTVWVYVNTCEVWTMELRHLRYFVAVAAEGSFSRASEKLHIAQPPLSRQIQQLEDELGARLFDRGRPITLTESGRYFYQQVRQLLARVDEIKSMTRRIAKGSVSQFRIGFAASILYESLPELIRRFRLSTPDVQIAMLEMNTLEQMGALKDGRIDVGFGRLRFGDAAITQKVVSQERLIAAIPTGHPLLELNKVLKLRHIAQEPLIIYPNAPRPSYADQVLSFYSDQGFEPVVAFEVGEMQTALGLVAAGGGICLIPASVRQLARDNVAYVDLDEPTLVSPVIISYRSNDQSALLAQLFTLVREFDRWIGPGALD